MGDFWEFIEAAWEYWGSAVITLSVAAFIWVLNSLYKQGSGSEGLPWYGFVLIAFLFLPFISYRLWLDQRRAHKKEIQNLGDSYRQTEDTLRQQLDELRAQLDMRTRRREQRETLAHFLNHGNKLLRIYTSPEDIASEPRDKWAYEVENYLSTSFDTSYSARWNNSIGIASSYSLNTEVSKENQLFLGDIHWRLIRLQEFIKELRDEE